MGATLGPPQSRALPAPLPRQDSQALRAVLRGAQVALGVLKPRRKELWASRDDDEWPCFPNSTACFKPQGVQGRLERVP